MDWPLRDSESMTSSDATRDSTPSTSTKAVSPRPLSDATGAPIISEADILCIPQLAVLCCRAIDAKSGPESILGDTFAAELVDRLNITGSPLGANSDIMSELMCLRAMIVDVDCLKFADAHRNEIGCMILNLSTGLDIIRAPQKSLCSSVAACSLFSDRSWKAFTRGQRLRLTRLQLFVFARSGPNEASIPAADASLS